MTVHMLRTRANDQVGTRCGLTLDARRRTLTDIGVTGWESKVTCTDCQLRDPPPPTTPAPA